MKVNELLDHLAAIGATARLEPPDTLLVFPADRLSSEMLEALRGAKHEIIEILRTHAQPRPYPCARCGKFFYPEPALLCYWCRQ